MKVSSWWSTSWTISVSVVQTSSAVVACDEGGYRRFAVIETSRGHEVADVERYAPAGEIISKDVLGCEEASTT